MEPPTAPRRFPRVTGLRIIGISLLFPLTAAVWRYHRNQQVPPFTPPAVVLPSPNAYNVYLQAIERIPWSRYGKLDQRLLILAFHDTPLSERRALLAQMGPEELWSKFQSPKTPENVRKASWPVVRDLVTLHADALRRVRSAFPYECRVLVRPNPTIYPNKSASTLIHLREMAILFRMEGAIAESEGRHANAAENYADCIEFGSDVTQGGAVTESMWSIALQSYGMEPLFALAGQLNGETAARLARRLELLEAQRTTLWVAFEQQRHYDREGLSGYLYGGGNSSDRLLGFNQETKDVQERLQRVRLRIEFDIADKQRMLDDIDLYYRQCIEQLKRPRKDRQLPSVPSLCKGLVCNANTVSVATDRHDARLRLLVVELALQAFRQSRGHPAESLNDLVPDFLSRIAADPYDGQPLRYRREGEDFLLYSIGRDGVDDGGRVCPGHGSRGIVYPCRDADCRGDLRAVGYPGAF
jgi:hypothetical protein